MFSMGEALDTSAVVGGGPTNCDAALEARFEAVQEEMADFRPRQPHEHPNLLGGEAAIPFERILVSLARGREAIDLAIGEGLNLLEERDQLMDLGYSRMDDYVREELGLPPGTAREKARLARELRTRPLLRQAVLSGKLCPRHARELFPVAQGEGERPWIALAEGRSVRELHARVTRAREANGGEAPVGSPAAASRDGDEPWDLVSLEVPAEYRVVVEEAMRLAGETLWPGAPTWQRLEAIAQEYLGEYGEEEEEPEAARPEEPAGGANRPEGAIAPEDLEKALEIDSNGWDWLSAVEPVAAPELSPMEPEALHARLQDLVGKQRGWDLTFGRMARIFVRKGLARQLGFANLGHYVKERLGMGRRAFEQRVRLERRMEELPQLRHALQRGEVSYEQARLVAGVADFDTVNEWIRRAGGMTCIELVRAIAGAEGAQACARGKVEVRTPQGVSRLLSAALRRAAGLFGPELFPGEHLLLLTWHFVPTWGPVFWGRRRPSPAKRRDGGFCTCPGCSRGWAGDHHLVFRSQGGSDRKGNLTGVCAPHHLRGIHGGRLRVTGTAPDHLVWTLRSGRRLGPAGRRRSGGGPP